jgi:hypothetical protein
MRYDPRLEHASFAIGGRTPVQVAITASDVVCFFDDVRDLQDTFNWYASGIDLDIVAQAAVLMPQGDSRCSVSILIRFEQTAAQFRMILDLDGHRDIVAELVRVPRLVLASAAGVNALTTGQVPSELVSFDLPDSVIDTLVHALKLPRDEFAQTETGWTVSIGGQLVGGVEVRRFATSSELNAAATEVARQAADASARTNHSAITLAVAGAADDMATLITGPLAAGTPVTVSVDDARALWRDLALAFGRELAAQGQLPGARESPELVARRVVGPGGPPGVPVFFVAFAYDDDASSRDAFERVHALLDDGTGGYATRLHYGEEVGQPPTAWLVAAITHDHIQKDHLFLFDWGAAGQSEAHALSDSVMERLVERGLGKGLTIVPLE